MVCLSIYVYVYNAGIMMYLKVLVKVQTVCKVHTYLSVGVNSGIIFLINIITSLSLSLSLCLFSKAYVYGMVRNMVF